MNYLLAGLSPAYGVMTYFDEWLSSNSAIYGSFNSTTNPSNGSTGSTAPPSTSANIASATGSLATIALIGGGIYLLSSTGILKKLSR